MICPRECNGHLTYYSSDHIHMNLNEHFEFMGGGESYNIGLKKESIPKGEEFQVILLGPQIKLKPEYMKISNSEDGTILTEKPNVGLLVNGTELSCVIDTNKDVYHQNMFL